MHLFLASVASALTVTEVLVPALTQSAIWLLGACAGVLIYGFLANHAVFENRGLVHSESFDEWDAILGSLLVGFFLFLVFHTGASGGSASADVTPKPVDMILGMVSVAFIFALLIGGILAALRLREIDWGATFGFSRLGVPAIFGWAVLLLLLAYPLIDISAIISQLILAAGGSDDDSNQEMVNFFMRSDSGGAKVIVAISAVIIAPMQEEFIFRGYIYGVARRYGGVIFGVLVNATVFALIHLHVPSFVPLFVLSLCLTMAYEWTGCLWVSMCMHALFNLVTVVTILSGHAD